MHILNIGSGVYSICLVYIHVDMDGEDREYSERTSFFWFAPLVYTLFLSQNSFSQLETAGLGHSAKMIRAALH